MDVLLNYADLQHIIAVKLCFFLFIAAGLVGIYKKWTYGYFLIVMGLASGFGYYFLVRGLQLPLWGLEGDEITIAAMYETFAHGSLLSDFAYANLPPFYPPLWFWVFGLFGRALDLNGVQIGKLAALVAIVFYPVVLYWAQKKFWNRQVGSENPQSIAWFLAPILFFIFIDWDAIILKPYEFVSASLAVFWTIALLYRLHHDKLTGKSIVWFGITGGVLFLLFYFWFFLAAIGVALFHLFWREKIGMRKYLLLFSVGAIMLAAGSPYWLPLVRSYALHGSENFQLGFFVTKWIATSGPLFDLSLRGLLMVAGLIALIMFRKHLYIRGLLSVFAAAYVWQIMGLATILFFASPLQESKGFYFWNGAILAFAAAYGAERLWRFFSEKYQGVSWQRSAALIGLLVLATQLIFGTFADQPKILAARDKSRAPEKEMRELLSFMKNAYSDIHQETTLHSSLTTIHAFLPLNDFIYFNQHNSHPAARFSERLAYLEGLAVLRDPKEFFDMTRDTPFGPIDLFVFYTGDPARYPVYFHLDNFPFGIKEKVVNIPRELFSAEFFDKKFENKEYVVFEPRQR